MENVINGVTILYSYNSYNHFHESKSSDKLCNVNLTQKTCYKH